MKFEHSLPFRDTCLKVPDSRLTTIFNIRSSLDTRCIHPSHHSPILLYQHTAQGALLNTMASKSSSSSSSPPVNCKLLLIGNSSVGKSSLLLRFSDEQWLPEDESSSTIGVDFRVSRLSMKVTRSDSFMRSSFRLVL